MNNPYLKAVSKTLLDEYKVDVIEDILLVRKDRIILYSSKLLDENTPLHVITGSLTLIGLEEQPVVTLKDILDNFEYNNAYADVAGRSTYHKYVRNELFTTRAYSMVTFPIRRNNEKIWISVSRNVVDANPNLNAYFITNMSDVMNSEEENYRKTHRDALTGLFNKYTLDYHYGKKYKHPDFHVMYLDIDNFKEINDSEGHASGDTCLVQFADILKEFITEYNRFYRNGGDEFIGLLFGSEAEIKETGQAIMQKVRQLRTPIYDRPLTVSIGVVQANIREDVIRKADVLLYKAKQMGKNRMIYEPEKIRQQGEDE